MVKFKFLAFILSICLLVACAPSQQAIQTAIAQTQAAIPTNTPTNIPAPTTSPAPKTAKSILESHGFTERTELETGCNCVVYKSAASTKGMTTIQIFDFGETLISAPIELNVVIPIVQELYNQEVATWISNNSTPPQGSDEYNIGRVGKYSVEVDFDSYYKTQIKMIIIK